MKNLSQKMLAGLTVGWFATASLALAQNDVPPPGAPPPAQDASAQTGDQTNAVAAVADTSPAVPESTNTTTAGTADRGLIANFRGVPVDTVLKYLADAAGFTIIRDADTRSAGNVDMVSTHPLNKDEIIGLFNKVLGRSGLAAIQAGDNTLEIMSVEAATVSAGTKVVVWDGIYTNVPQDSTTVTEIIPLHSLNPTQVIKDLFLLRPADAVMSANEGGNAIIMTAKQSDIRRFTQIISALDSSGNGDLEVFLLTYADSKSIAQELKDVFSPTDATAAGGNPFATIFGGGGRGGRGGGGGGAFGGGAAADDNPKRAAVKVNAVSDDENNAVLVSAPADIMPGISNLIVKLDIPQEDNIEIRVFPLAHADPSDIVNELSAIFPDPTAQAQQGNTAGRGRTTTFTGGGGRGGAGGGRAGGGGGGGGAGMSDRMKKQTTVYSVPDARTQSVIVTASKDTMVEIEKMIEHLDENPARTMHVYVYHPQYSDALDMQQPLQDLFASTSSRSTSTQVNALQTRAQQAAQTSTINTSSTQLGGTGGGGGAKGP